jgi:hypothetical protein
MAVCPGSIQQLNYPQRKDISNYAIAISRVLRFRLIAIYPFLEKFRPMKVFGFNEGVKASRQMIVPLSSTVSSDDRAGTRFCV